MGGGLIQLYKFDKKDVKDQEVLTYAEFEDLEQENLLELRHLEPVHKVLEELFPDHDVDDNMYDYYVLSEEKLDILISKLNEELVDQSKELSEYFYERYSKKVNTLLECLEEQATDFDFDGDEVLTISWGD